MLNGEAVLLEARMGRMPWLGLDPLLFIWLHIDPSATTTTTVGQVLRGPRYVKGPAPLILKMDSRWHSFLEQPIKINAWATLAQKLVNPPYFKQQWTTGWNSFTWESYFIMLPLRGSSFCWWGVYQTQCGELQYLAPFSKIWRSVTWGFAKFHPNGDPGQGQGQVMFVINSGIKDPEFRKFKK